MRGRLWRAANPNLPSAERERHVHELMDARRAVGAALRADDVMAAKAARQRVHAAKLALGERGPVWWDDGAPDYNRHLVKNTPYAEQLGNRPSLGRRSPPASATARRPVRPKAKADGRPPPGA